MEWLLVAIKWEDITSLVRFNLRQDFEAKRLYKLSVGFVVKETKDYVVIADDLDLDPDKESYNNYGTLIPKGCIREWRTICRLGRDLGREAPEEPGAIQGGSAHLLLSFLRHNPNMLATAKEVALRLGVDKKEAKRQLDQLERKALLPKAKLGGQEVYQSGQKISRCGKDEPRR